MPNKEDEIGAVWERSTRDGKLYMTGSINGQDVVIFHNDYKKPGEKSPDWRVYKSQPRDAALPSATPAGLPTTHNAPKPIVTSVDGVDLDDIPF